MGLVSGLYIIIESCKKMAYFDPISRVPGGGWPEFGHQNVSKSTKMQGYLVVLLYSFLKTLIFSIYDYIKILVS